MKRISILHPYLENRLPEIKAGTYPKQHLWGIDGLKKDPNYKVKIINTEIVKIPMIIEKLIDKIVFRSQSSFRIELAAIKASKKSDLIYSIYGPLALNKFLKKTKIVSWVFGLPKSVTKSLLHPYEPENLKRNTGFFCLTPDAESIFSKYGSSKFLPWCIDMKFFTPTTIAKSPNKKFFIAAGKTNRDYDTLIRSASGTNAEIRIIGPATQKWRHLPKNVVWIDTSKDPPDEAIDYLTLRNWYEQSIGVCIPLTGNAEDTCGYTNMLESMAMGKPVLMTRSGCLHINPKIGNFGKIIEPQDFKGWRNSMNEFIDNPTLTRELGKNGRKLAEQEFSIDKFDQSIKSFISNFLEH